MDMPKRKNGPGSRLERLPSKIQYDYIKSNLFRAVHADGVLGGPAPTGTIRVAFFNERFPIPKEAQYKVNPDGTIGPEIPKGRRVRGAIIREVDVDVVMTLPVAKIFCSWLNEKIEALARHQDRIKKP